MYQRNQTKVIKVGNLYIGKDYPIVIQSMCNTKTKDTLSTINQILKLEKYGCQLIRVAVLDKEDAYAIQEIKKHIHIPLVADIHFDYELALLAIQSGADKIRINPGNIGSEENIYQVVSACKEKDIPIRIGINSGSLEKDLVEKYGVSAKTMIESAKRHIQILNKFHFDNIILSLKSSNPDMCIEAYKQAAEIFSYPLHLGITEPGPLLPGIVKSTTVLNQLLQLGIGNTLRISLSDDPLLEIKAAKQILKANHLLTMPTLISCPTCGRTQINLIPYAQEIDDFLYTISSPLCVAIMGCVVNGPGEAKEADIGIAGGKSQAVLFKKGKIVKTLKEDAILETLKNEILLLNKN